MADKYDHKKTESKWQEYWKDHPELYKAVDGDKAEKRYILDMFPYPSSDGLHVGHVESYTATDIISRYLKMKGKNVLHPQGWDAFGLPAENYAIKTKTHPKVTTTKAIRNFKRQIDYLGFSYDWSRELNSSDPVYYKWTQWFFLLFYKNGLAYKGKAKVNWCNNCQTVLANEQAEGGICERCKQTVIQKELEQWFFKITDFMEDRGKTMGLINGLDKIDWPNSTKVAQRNWIGKSAGAQFKMAVENSDKSIEVFTTRLDTVFGCTYAIIAPEHRLVQELKPEINNWSEVEKYIEEAGGKSELLRISEVREKTGVELKGVKVINPFTKKVIPLFTSDFILAHYGTGAVMAVPGHDQRDYDFAKKFALPIVEVIKSVDKKSSIGKEAYIQDGILMNSGEYNNLTSAEARQKMINRLEEKKIGHKKINYKLRDWLISRQRYWGAPIPIIYCRKCWENSKLQIPNPKQIQNSNVQKNLTYTNFSVTKIDGLEYAMIPVPEKDLPVLLPDDVDFMPHGESPLARSKKFHDVKCPKCGAKARREVDTMDTFVCSSWYYLRYSDPNNKEEFAVKEKLKYWLPVDLYVGGAEHTVLHLLYSRFFIKALHHLGYLTFDEPFKKLRHQGIILAEDGRKMSKSYGNVINPDVVVKQYGADALRMFEMFMGPLEDMKPWNTKGIIGISRFLERVWRISFQITNSKFQTNPKSKIQNPKLKSLLHKTIRKVSEDIEDLKFNTAISALMILVNEFMSEKEMIRKDYETFLKLLAPFAPHLAEELWSSFAKATEDKSQNKYKESIFKQSWPVYNPELIREENIELVVQINGKVRDKLAVSADISEVEAKKIALESGNIKKWLAGKEPLKTIFVKGKLVNIVVK